MKYGSTINKRVIEKLPYDRIIAESEFCSRYQVMCDFLKHLRGLTKTKEGVFGYTGRWRIRIHTQLGTAKIDYFPRGREHMNEPKGRVHEKFMVWKRRREA